MVHHCLCVAPVTFPQFQQVETSFQTFDTDLIVVFDVKALLANFNDLHWLTHFNVIGRLVQQIENLVIVYFDVGAPD